MSGDRIKSIASLNVGQSVYDWKIKAKVVAKSPLRSWRNAAGKMFSIDLRDGTGEIRAVMLTDKYYEMIQCGNVYIFSKFNLKKADRQFNFLNHDCEITFSRNAEVEMFKERRCKYVALSQIQCKNNQESVDIIGICLHIGELCTFQKSNGECKKRDVILVDDKEDMATLTLFNNDVDKIQFRHQSLVISVAGGIVTEYKGNKSVQLWRTSVLKVEPDVPQCRTLRNWFDKTDQKRINSAILTRRCVTIQQARTQRLDYFETVGVIHIVNSFIPFYKACAQQECKASVKPQDSGYYCHKCSKTAPDFKYQLRLEIQIADPTSERTVICYNDSAEELFQCKATDVAEAMSVDPSKAKEFFKDVLYKPYVFTLKVDTGSKYRQLILYKSQRLCPELHAIYLCRKLDEHFKSLNSSR